MLFRVEPFLDFFMNAPQKVVKLPHEEGQRGYLSMSRNSCLYPDKILNDLGHEARERLDVLVNVVRRFDHLHNFAAAL